MNIFVEVLLALGLAFLIFLLWGYLRERTGSDKYDRRVEGRGKGLDSIGVAVVCFCHDGAGKYLVAQRSERSRDERGAWEPGSGSVEFGERLEDAVRREMREEYSVEVMDLEFMGFRDVHRLHEGRKTHWIVFDYRARVDPQAVRIGEPEMLNEIRWVRLEDIPTPRHSQFALFLEKYKNKL